MLFYPPMITVGVPMTITPPCAVVSPCLAAGAPPIITVAEPCTIVSGGPTQAEHGNERRGWLGADARNLFFVGRNQ